METIKFYMEKFTFSYLSAFVKAAVSLVTILVLTVFSGSPASWVRLPGSGEQGHYSIGFGKADITPATLTDEDGNYIYHLAGFSSNSYNFARSVAAHVYARAVWIDDNKGAGGMMLVAVDCIGLSKQDVNKMRKELSDFSRKSGCKSIQIMSIHCHESVDTLGLWGDMYGLESGINEGYMRVLYDGVKAAVKAAYNDRRDGALYYGETNASSMTYTGDDGNTYHFNQYDQREPYIADGRLIRFRFVPDNGSSEIYILNYSAHPEMMYLRGGEDQMYNVDPVGSVKANSLLSADYVGWLHEKIKTDAGADSILFQGAIGGLIELRCAEFNVQSYSDYMLSNGYATYGELFEMMKRYCIMYDEGDWWNSLDEGSKGYFLWCDGLTAAIETDSFVKYTKAFTDGYYDRALGFCVKRTQYAGYALAQCAIGIKDSEKLDVNLSFAGKELDIPVSNTVYMLGGFVDIVHGKPMFGKFNGKSALMYRTEIGYMKIGDKKIALIPGELFPELAYGGYLGDDRAVNPGVKNPSTLAEISGDDGVIVFGLANDHLGYIVPPNDFYLDKDLPYFQQGAIEQPDGSHKWYYNETNSFGPHTADCLADAFKALCETIPD